MNYFNFYYNTFDNKKLNGIFTGEDEIQNFRKFIDLLKMRCDYDYADYGLSEKIVFQIPKGLKGKKFFNTILKDYVVFSPDSQGSWGDYDVNSTVFTADWGEEVENAYHHIEQLIDLEQAEWE